MDHIFFASNAKKGQRKSLPFKKGGGLVQWESRLPYCTNPWTSFTTTQVNGTPGVVQQSNVIWKIEHT